MTTALITHTDCLKHRTPDGHPEQIARLEHVLTAIDGKTLERFEAPMGSEDDLRLVHPQSHIERVRSAEPDEGIVQLDADTWMSPGSFDAAMRGVGGALKGVDLVLGGEVGNAFVATRPPGHHAETERTMGFCLFGTAAIAARHAMERHGLSRVAVVDFDVHHGNGTQDLLWSEERSFFVSSHQFPLWPGTGRADERGAHGNVLNLPLDPASDGATMRQAYEEKVFPALEAFTPELLILSAGFDAHRDDPLAELQWDESDFTWLTGRLCDLADAHCKGRVVSCMEGGYNLEALARCAAAHVDVLIERGG
ncbi:histone deacetylase family protein [Roseovarius sp. PS-C2]|uniref:histone deacetylase family protein n=1 Tax=Roseovarius sp. PS-C2 TaxID=2820814 RepID=UPI001C0E03B3|nr:histone deacetylase family protein [Roseovarius sp. PS-C2]MBU3261395.1 histone deacetylase family protein [Roseovarius sp. PS-C2]